MIPPARETAISLNAMESVQEHLKSFKQEDLNKELIQLNEGGEKAERAELPNLFCLIESIGLHNSKLDSYMQGFQESLLGGTCCTTVEECNSWYKEFEILMLELLESAANIKLNATNLQSFRESVRKQNFFSITKLVKNYCDYVTSPIPIEFGPRSAPLIGFLDLTVTGEVLQMISLYRGNYLAMDAIAVVLLEHYVVYPVSRHIPDYELLVSKIKSQPIFLEAINENRKYKQFQSSANPDVPRHKIILGMVGSSVVYSEDLLYDVQHAPEGEYFYFADPWPGKAKAKGKYKLELANHTVVIPEVYVVPDILMNSFSMHDLTKSYTIVSGIPYTSIMSLETGVSSVIAALAEEDPRPFIVSLGESRRYTNSREAQGDMVNF